MFKVNNKDTRTTPMAGGMAGNEQGDLKEFLPQTSV